MISLLKEGNGLVLDGSIQAWLNGRRGPEEGVDITTISAPESLRSVGFADLVLEKYGSHHEEIAYSLDGTTQKAKNWTELNHLVSWSDEFLNSLKNNKSTLATLELIRGVNEFPISLANFHVDESIGVVQSALNFDVGIDIQHPDTRGHNYAVNNILVDDSTGLHDIVRQVFTCLYSRCLVRLIVKTNQFYSAALATYLVDLMHQSGATTSEVSCVAFNSRESIGNERFNRCVGTVKSNSKLSIVAVVFKQSDSFAAAQGIIESYFREQYLNLIVLVEESIYDMFVKDWQRYYSHAIHIGSRLDPRTTVVATFNDKVMIDLAAIDIKASHKMTGNVINVLKFRTFTELMSLMSNLRKVPNMTIWNDDLLLSRELCLRINPSNEFWLNHIPKNLSGPRFPEHLMSFYADTVAEDMTNIYNSVYYQYADDAELLRKMLATFTKKNSRLRTKLIIQAFTSLVTKCKSLRNGSTTCEVIARLKRFQQTTCQRIDAMEAGDSRVEIIAKPVGLALLLVREDNPLKSKPVLVEFIFKNLLIGNAVLLVCPPNTLGAKFSFDNDHVVPFKMVHESLPDISRLSLDESIGTFESSYSKNKCPSNTYAVEVMPEMTNEACEAITVALGVRHKRIWYPDVDHTNYWSNE